MEPPQNDPVFKRPGSPNTIRFQLDINGKTYTLHEGVNTIGRSPTAVVNIKSLNVSHVHAIITVVNGNELYVTDMKSANGTELESLKLNPLKLYRLEDNARIKFANICGVFKKNASPRQRNHASQDMSQAFYSEVTQPMFEDIHDLPTQAQNVHDMPTQLFASQAQDIHEMPPRDVHDMPTQMFETVDAPPPPQAFEDVSTHDTSENYFMPSTTMLEAIASSSSTGSDVEVIKIIVEDQGVVSASQEPDECTQIPVGRVKRKNNPLDSPPAEISSEECSQFPVGRVKRKGNALDSPETSPVVPEETQDSQIPARPMPKKPNVFDTGSSLSPVEEETKNEETVIRKRSIYALSSDSDTDLEEDDKINSSDVIPCTQEFSCLTESFNLKIDETQEQIDKENVSLNVQLDLSNDDEIVDETVYHKSPEANLDVSGVSKQGESSKRQEVSMDLTCISKQGESSKRQEVSMDLTCTSIKSSQNEAAKIREAIPEENEEEQQTQIDYFEPPITVEENQSDESPFLPLPADAEDQAAPEEETGVAPLPGKSQSEEMYDAYEKSTSVESIPATQDDVYLQPTQCLYQSEPIVIDTEDVYFQATQLLNEEAAVVTNAEKNDSDTEKEASQTNGGGIEETSKIGQGLKTDDVETNAEKEDPDSEKKETPIEENDTEAKGFEETTAEVKGDTSFDDKPEKKSVEDSIEENIAEEAKIEVGSGSTEITPTDKEATKDDHVFEIPETLPTCSKDSRTVVLSKSNAEIPIDNEDPVEANIATIFNDTNPNNRSKNAVEDQLQMLFHTQRDKEEAFECTQHLVKALEESMESEKDTDLVDDSMDILSTQTLVATLNKSDVGDDSFDITQPWIVMKDAQVKTYSKAGGGNSGTSSCSSDATVIDLGFKNSEETKAMGGDEEESSETAKAVEERIEVIYVNPANKGSSESVEEKPDDVDEVREEASKKSTRISMRKSANKLVKEKTVPEQRREKGDAKSEDDMFEEAPMPRQSRRGTSSKSGAVDEETSGSKSKGAASKRVAEEAVSKRKTGSKIKNDSVESGDDTETGSVKQSEAKAGTSKQVDETAKPVSRPTSRSVTESKPGSFIQLDDTPRPGRPKRKAPEMTEPSPERDTSTETESVSERRTGSKRKNVDDPKESEDDDSKTSSIRLKSGIFKQFEDTPKPGRAGSETPSRAGSRTSSRQSTIESKPGTSKQPDETPKPGRTKKIPPAKQPSPERNASTETESVSKRRTVSTRKKVDDPGEAGDDGSETGSVRLKSATSRQLEDTPKPGRAGSETPSRPGSRSSSRQSTIESRPGPSKQPDDDTPKPGRAKKKQPVIPETNTRSSKSRTSQKGDRSEKSEESEKEEEKEKVKTRGRPAKRKTDEAEGAKPKKKTKMYDSGDEFEMTDSPESARESPKKPEPVTKTRKRGGGVVEKVTVTVPKTKQVESAETKKAVDEPGTSKKAAEPESSGATKPRRLSANSRSVRNAQQAVVETKTTRKRSAPQSEDVDEDAPKPAKKSLGDSPERNRRKTKPKVIFTMMDDPVLESMVRQLGGSVVDSVQASTVLVTGSVKRSLKLLMAVGSGKPICSPQWIKASKKASNFLDPWDHILEDKEAEKKWDFSLRESLSRSQNFRLFEDYTFQICVTTAVDVLKGAIETCGGKVVTKGLAKCTTKNLVVVGTKDVEKKYAKIIKDNPAVIVVEPEAIFDGTLRQELRFDRHLIK